MTWRVTLHAEVQADRAALAGDTILQALRRRVPRLKSEVRVTDLGVDVVLEGIEAKDADDAKKKAQYWCRRAVKAPWRWHPLAHDQMEAECLPT